MNEDKIVRIAGAIFLGFVVVPAVVGTAINLGTKATVGIYNGIQKVKFNKKIKKGLEDGSIVEIDGKYYEVEVTEPVEEA